jgi:anti-sigma factor RsiW
MTGPEFDDATLMAFADGELAPALAARVAAAVAQDPAAAARVALFRDTRTVLRAAAARPLDPVPDALMARVRATLDSAGPATPAPARVVPLAAHRPSRVAATALAASLALAIGAAGGFLLARGPSAPAKQAAGPGAGTPIPLLAALGAADVAAALSSAPSGELRTVAAGELVPVATFLSGTGETCREFTLAGADGDTVTAVACHGGDGWDLRLAMVAEAAGAGYAPASAPEVLDHYFAMTAAGAPLSPEDEAAALARLAR